MRIEGYAVAGGKQLALWADMRVVAEDATFGVFCRRFGVPLIDLGTIRLPRLIGHSQAMDLILTGRPVGGAEALRMGLANRLVAKGESRAQAIQLAKDIARFPQTCLRADRLSALRQWDLEEEDAIANEMRGGLQVIASGETLSGASRFASGIGRHGAFGGSMLLDRGYVYSQSLSPMEGYINLIMFSYREIGYASALAWVMFSVTMTITIILFRSARRWVYFPEESSHENF